MAATVIDALIVELGLDPKKFTDGQKKAGESMLKLKKDAEDSGKKVSQAFTSVRTQLLSMLAIFAGGVGLKEFVSMMVEAEAETARFAKQLDSTVQELSSIRGAAVLAGGSAAGALGQVQSLVQEFQNYSLTGQSSIIPFLYALNVGISDNEGHMKSITQYYLDLAKAVEGMPDKARAAALLKGAGITDQGTLNMLLQGQKAVKAMIEEQKRLGVMTDEDAAAGLRMQHSWLALQQSSQSLGRVLLTQVAPVLVKILDGLTNIAVWTRAHKPLLEAFFASLGAAAIGLTIAFFPVTGTVLAITAAVVALSAGIGLLYDDWKVWTEGGKSSFGGFWQFVTDKVSGFSQLVGPAFEAGFTLIKDFLKNVADALKFVGSLFFGTSDEIRESWAALWGDAVSITMDAVTGLPKLFNLIGYGITKMVVGVLNWLQGRANAFWHAITGHDLFKAIEITAPPLPQEPGKAPAAPPAAATGPVPKPAAAPPGAPTPEVIAAAKAAEVKYGVPADVTIAQYQLESGNGKHMPAGSNNPFGIKAKDGQPYVEAMTKEFIHGKMVDVKQRFAKFDSLADAFDAHAKLLATMPAYAAAREAKTAPDYADALTGKYATDPAYGAKLRALMSANAQRQVASNTTNSTSHQTRIDKVIVNSQATDAEELARDIRPAIERDSFASQANNGSA